jgi:hypothetical protein
MFYTKFDFIYYEQKNFAKGRSCLQIFKFEIIFKLAYQTFIFILLQVHIQIILQEDIPLKNYLTLFPTAGGGIQPPLVNFSKCYK